MAFTDTGEEALQRVSNATRTLQARGPDHTGYFEAPHMAMGHCRLSVLDPSAAAHQPFSDPTGRYTIVYNGECYNFREIAEQIAARGFQPVTHSDTEVILAAYILEGPAFLDSFRGFFALAIFDRETKELFLARDRFGIKPLFYYKCSDFFCFASEQKALFAYPVPRVLDLNSLHLYLHLNYVPGPQTMIRGILHLEPGCYARLRGNRFESHAYFDPPSGKDYLSGKTCTSSDLADAIRYSVRSRLISDVPLGTFLSGGIDSSIITALAKQEGGNIRTFTMGFKDQPYLDESEQAEATARFLGTDHTTFHVTGNDLLESAYQIQEHQDEPFADSSAVAMNLLAGKTRQEVTVALSGDGGDELFAGYRKHKAEQLMRRIGISGPHLRFLRLLPPLGAGGRGSKAGERIRQIQKFIDGLSLSSRERYWKWCGFTSDQDLHQLEIHETDEAKRRSSKWTSAIHGESNDLNDMLAADVRLVLAYDMLVKTDRMSMAHGLEVRVPFMDHDVVRCAFQMPAKNKMKGGQQKYVLKECFASILPPDIFNRPKKGFEIPIARWLRNEMRTDIQTTLSADALAAYPLLKPDEVARMVKACDQKYAGDYPARVWGLYLLYKWLAKYQPEIPD
ncbi:MAG: asparagine synthase (glutamine-hydrolyzing) [Flavobacteriales bacterium]|nr:asparagine synthase (glutamine-hydrolyzing) [Flavobacteriales bacterium]